jgi:hypothetical protein
VNGDKNTPRKGHCEFPILPSLENMVKKKNTEFHGRTIVITFSAVACGLADKRLFLEGTTHVVYHFHQLEDTLSVT